MGDVGAAEAGNYKGVMLCNRPFAGVAAAAKAGGGLEVGGSGKAFLSGAVPKPHGANVPIAFEPPPTHATTTSGSLPACSSICARASRPMTDCRFLTIVGNGCGPTAEPIR